MGILIVSPQLVKGYEIPGTYQTIGGEITNYSQYEGNILLLELFSVECGYCKSQHVELGKLYDILEPGKKILSITIGAADTLEDLDVFINEYPTSWGIGLDINGYIQELTGVIDTPTMIYLSEKGEELGRRVGYTGYETLKSDMDNYEVPTASGETVDNAYQPEQEGPSLLELMWS